MLRSRSLDALRDVRLSPFATPSSFKRNQVSFGRAGLKAMEAD